jgi:hypothetical protein
VLERGMVNEQRYPRCGRDRNQKTFGHRNLLPCNNPDQKSQPEKHQQMRFGERQQQRCTG